MNKEIKKRENEIIALKTLLKCLFQNGSVPLGPLLRAVLFFLFFIFSFLKTNFLHQCRSSVDASMCARVWVCACADLDENSDLNCFCLSVEQFQVKLSSNLMKCWP